MKLIAVDHENPQDGLLEEAAHILQNHGLVAFPTETVYGLGALATSDEAVAKIFAAKGRPPTNPLIVHVADLDAAQSLVKEWPPEAEALARAFWPGPLTLVLRRTDRISPLVSAGLDTIAIRVPAHPVAKRLLELTAAPIAAPSANPYTRISPTTAQHVVQGLGDAVDLVIDGGQTPVGLESTLLSLVDGPPTLLRRGMISKEQIEKIIPLQDKTSLTFADHRPRHSPGLARKHYSPERPTRLVDSPEFQRLLNRRSPTQAFLGRGAHPDQENLICLPDNPEDYARGLYSALHRFDRAPFEQIIIERPPLSPEWEAIADRLWRASTE